MIADLQPYREYRNSGLAWLPRVPSHWKIVRNGSLFGQRKDLADTALPILEVSLKTGVRVREFGSSKRKQVMSDISKYKRAAKADLAYNMMRMWQGAVGVVPVDGLVSPAYVVARPFRNVRSPYYVALFRTDDYMSEIDNYSRGIVKDRNRLYWDHFKQMPSPYPPPEEQDAIVRFLDWANGRLDRAIRAKRKVISLLQEQKQAIIHRAVTRGLDPNVPLKPSGIPWVGDIPANWNVRKIRTVADLIVSNVDKHSKPHEEVVRLCNYTDVYKNERITATRDFMVATATKDEIARCKLRVGDVVITKDSEEWNDIGVPALVCYEADDLICGYHLAILRTRLAHLHGEFLYRTLQDCFVATQMHVRAKGVTRYGLSHQVIKDVLLPIPPINEQTMICDALNTDLHTFNTAITHLERGIALLSEYRTRIVVDVVTGMRDVREVSRDLPVESVESGTEPAPEALAAPDFEDIAL